MVPDVSMPSPLQLGCFPSGTPQWVLGHTRGCAPLWLALQPPSNKPVMGTSDELRSLPVVTRGPSTYPCLTLTIPAAPAPQPPLPTHMQTLVPPPDQGSPSGPPGLFLEAAVSQGNPVGSSSGQAQQTRGQAGASQQRHRAGVRLAGAGVRRRPSHGYNSICLWGLAWCVAGNRAQRHAGHRD